MKALLIAGSWILLAACAAGSEAPSGAPARPQATSPTPPADRIVALKNAGFEEDAAAGYRCAPKWSCTMHANPESFKFLLDETQPASGKRSLLVQPAAHQEPWALVMQMAPDFAKLRGARVRFSLAVRMEGVQGKGAGPMAIVQWPWGADLNHWKSQESGTSGWKRMQVEFVVPKEGGLLEVGAILEGNGKVWIDDARLEILEPAPAK